MFCTIEYGMIDPFLYRVHCSSDSQCCSTTPQIAHMSQKPNGILIGSAVFAQYINVTDRQTHRPRYVWNL